MAKVKPKKHLGQHFLKDTAIARKIVEALQPPANCQQVLEIGPGMGVLTTYLLQNESLKLTVVDVDKESTSYLASHLPELAQHILTKDFLATDWLAYFNHTPFAVIGNFPYNISSQIFFKVLEMRMYVPQVVGMVQKEVAQRIASPSGNKTYGILSVLLQAYYDIEYLFTVKPGVFNPPPKVDSAVIRLRRNQTQQLGCNEVLFVKVVKQGFQNRRKTLRNALKRLALPAELQKHSLLDKRAEQLAVADFVRLTNLMEEGWKK